MSERLEVGDQLTERRRARQQRRALIETHEAVAPITERSVHGGRLEVASGVERLRLDAALTNHRGGQQPVDDNPAKEVGLRAVIGSRSSQQRRPAKVCQQRAVKRVRAEWMAPAFTHMCSLSRVRK